MVSKSASGYMAMMSFVIVVAVTQSCIRTATCICHELVDTDTLLCCDSCTVLCCTAGSRDMA